MGKITTKTRLLILFLSLGGVAYAQVQNENTYPYPQFNDVGIGTTFTTNSSGSINYKFTTAGKLYEHVHFNPETGSNVVLKPTIPLRILAERYEDFHEVRTNFLFEARVYPFNEPVETNQRVFSLQKEGQLLLGATSNSTISYGFPYSIVSDNSIYSQDKIFAQNRIGIGTTNPAASLDVVNGDIALNDNRLKLRGAASSTHYLQFNSSFQGSTVNGPVLMGANGGVLGSSNQGTKVILSWKHTGRVGINTINPSTNLEVNGSVRFDSDALTDDEIQFETHNGFHRIAHNELRFHEWSFGDILTLSDGKVGIGTTSPASVLDVDGGDVSLNDNKLRLRGATDGNHYLQFKQYYQGEPVDGPILSGYGGGVLATSLGGDKNVLKWTSDGRVGINTNSPNKALEVNGTAFIRNENTESSRGVTDFNYNIDGNSGTLLELANGDMIIGGGPSNNKFIFHTQYWNANMNALHIAPIENGSHKWDRSLKLFTEGKLLKSVSLETDIAYQVYTFDASNPGFHFQVYGNGNVEAKELKSIVSPLSDGLVVENNSTNEIEFKVKGNGFVYAREVEVSLGTFPDYVFDEKYNLMSLEELRKYISKNNHLPGVKSADEVEKEGIGLGELSKVQMEKIEELTLYILQMEERIKQLEAKLGE